MLLAVDIGNSNIVLGLAQSQTWEAVWRITTSVQRGASAYAREINMFFLESNQKAENIQKVVLSSVVPGLTDTMMQVLHELFGLPVLRVGPDIYSRMPMAIERPHEIGSDLVANAVAAYDKFKDYSIVVDFGTALTFTTVSDSGQILGVAIAPGLKTAMYALFKNTAQLPEVPLELPPSAIGKNTTQALQAGVLLGYVGLVESLLARIQKELAQPCKVVATGGLSAILGPVAHLFDEIDPHLTLNGLRLIAEHYG
ncbi:MAG: type III pantothenate kinase [Microscillaceae bacterium]